MSKEVTLNDLIFQQSLNERLKQYTYLFPSLFSSLDTVSKEDFVKFIMKQTLILQKADLNVKVFKKHRFVELIPDRQ